MRSGPFEMRSSSPLVDGNCLVCHLGVTAGETYYLESTLLPHDGWSLFYSVIHADCAIAPDHVTFAAI